MAENRSHRNQEISVDSLKKGMVIKSYSRFSARYQPMDKATSTFIKLNFRQSRAIVTRDQQKLTIPIDKIREGDTLNRISNIPSVLKKLTIVANERFIKELRKRGMLGFTVENSLDIDSRSKKELREMLRTVGLTPEETSPKRRTLKQELRNKQAAVANSLIASVQENVKIRDNIVSSIQDGMDRIRKGGLDISLIKSEAKKMLQSSTADGIMTSVGLRTGDAVYTHAVDVCAIFQHTYFQILEKLKKQSSFQSKEQAITGAILHDIGKSKIPKELLDRDVFFEKGSREMQILRSHPVFGADLLSRMNQPEVVVNMARYHHVKKNQSMLSSYPSDVDFKDINFETRLLAIVDIYQAFVGKRKYKKAWSAPAAMRYLDALAGIEFDAQIWERFLHTIGIFPKGSLVQLNNNSLAFVLTVPKRVHDLERPLVAVVQNGKGERLTHHDLIDLKIEKDVSITKDIDPTEVFGDSVFDNFVGITV